MAVLFNVSELFHCALQIIVFTVSLVEKKIHEGRSLSSDELFVRFVYLNI